MIGAVTKWTEAQKTSADADRSTQQRIPPFNVAKLMGEEAFQLFIIQCTREIFGYGNVGTDWAEGKSTTIPILA